jgi:uncharacterized membrane protein
MGAPQVSIAASLPGAAADAKARGRIESIDLVRGLIIIVMALDHVRDFFGDPSARPTDLATASTALFFTRWITHICAPVFFLLTGTGAYLTRARMPRTALSRFLLTRGLWLIFLELIVMRFALQFNVDYQVTVITVLWALGWSMIVLAGLVWLPLWAIALFGFLLIAGHNALDAIQPAMGIPSGWAARLWVVLHQPGFLYRGSHSVLISYVLIPWVGVSAVGYALGAVFEWSADARQRFLMRLGLGLIAGFIMLRLANVYGDPIPWAGQSTVLRTAMSILNTTKYPPSLLFLLMTLGPALLLFCAFDARIPPLLRPALTFGRVPLCFFVLHFYLIHLLAVGVSYLRYGEVTEMFRSPDIGHFPFSALPGWDVGLPVIYLIWIGVVAALYPLCRRFAAVRRDHRQWWWLSYL